MACIRKEYVPHLKLQEKEAVLQVKTTRGGLIMQYDIHETDPDTGWILWGTKTLHASGEVTYQLDAVTEGDELVMLSPCEQEAYTDLLIEIHEDNMI